MREQSQFIIQKPGGVVLKAIQELSGDKGWVSLKNIYGFIDSFFDYVENNEPANDLATFHDTGWIKTIDYIPSLGNFVYLTKRGRKAIEKGVVPECVRNEFYNSINKARNSAI